jgi:hypothetical protein
MDPVIETKPLGRSVPRLSGFSLILIATIAAGVSSYVVTWLVPFRIGAEQYAFFAIFWSFTYLVVGALAGIQQEITRATVRVPVGASPQVSRARNFGVVAAIAVFLLVVGSAPLWVTAAFPVGGWKLVLPLAIGTASSVIVVVLCGTLYGLAAWMPLALMMTVDAFTRLLLIAVVLTFTTSIVALAWAVAVPFPLTVVILWPFIRKSVVGRTQLDVHYRTLTWNVIRTIVAAASTGVMVSGFPFLLGLSSASESRVTIGLFILTITLTRAPLIVVAMSFQSYFVVVFRNAQSAFWGVFLKIQAVIVGCGLVLAAAAWFAGPPVFAILFPREPTPDGGFLALLVFSSALVAAMCVSAPAVLARGQHFVYSCGWVAGAVVTIVAVFLPLGFTARTFLALFSGPAAGLAVYGIYLVSAYRRSAPGEPVVPKES